MSKSKLSFKEYCESKEYLRLAAENIPQITERYELTKYCKFPIVMDEDGGKQYVSFRPKDTIEVLWEFLNPEVPVARKVIVCTDEEDNQKIQPAWGNTKLSSWLNKNTHKRK